MRGCVHTSIEFPDIIDMLDCIEVSLAGLLPTMVDWSEEREA